MAHNIQPRRVLATLFLAGPFVNPDAKPNELFRPGPTPDDPPTGDIEREAVASLRGYAYQVVVRPWHGWDLDDHGRLYLEVAEDYAMVAEAIAQRGSSQRYGRIRHHHPEYASSEGCDYSFIELVKNNKGRNVHLRYFTTSPIGAELKVSDRPAVNRHEVLAKGCSGRLSGAATCQIDWWQLWNRCR